MGDNTGLKLTSWYCLTDADFCYEKSSFYIIPRCRIGRTFSYSVWLLDNATGAYVQLLISMCTVWLSSHVEAELD